MVRAPLGVAVAEVLHEQLFAGHRAGRLTAVRAEHLEDTSQPLGLHLEYEMPGWFSVSGSRLIGHVPAILESVYLEAPPVAQRSSPFELSYPLRLESRVHLAPPRGFAISARDGTAHSEPGAQHVDYRGSIPSGGDEALLSFDATLHPGRHPASDYASYYRESSSALRFFDRTIELSGP